MGPEHGRLAQVETMLPGNREDVVHTRGGMDVVANGLVLTHLGEDVVFWLRLPMKLHVANAVAVSLLSTAVLVLAFKEDRCEPPTPTAAPQATAQATPQPAAPRPRIRRELGKF